LIAENVAYTAVCTDFVGYIDKEGSLYCTGLNNYGLVGNGEKIQTQEIVPDRNWIYDRNEFVFPPYKTLTDIAYTEIPPNKNAKQ